MTKHEEKFKTLLGNHIRSLRKAQNLTQQQLGEKADINYKFLGAIERGLQNPSLLVLYKIAKALNVETVELFSFDHHALSRKEIEKRINNIVASKDDNEIRQLYIVLKAIFLS